MNTNELSPVSVGNVYTLVMPWSEVCMVMKISGHAHDVEIRANGAYIDGGRGPHITWSEAGIMSDGAGGLMAKIAASWE